MKPSLRKECRIGIDLMGSENSPASLLETLSTISLDADVELIIIAPPSFKQNSTFIFHEATEIVQLDDHPVTAFKKKQNSSMFVGLSLLKEGKIDALISSGNTGALLLGAKRILSTLPRIDRPALLALFPSKKTPVAILDVGANVHCKPKHLVQFAHLASAYLSATQGIQFPKVGLLNIGEEPLKGRSELRAAYNELKAMPNAPFQFVGNVEGHSVFNGDVDALVTDGFTGNTFLKTTEALASFVLGRIQSQWPESTLKLLKKEIEELQTYLHYSEYRGALLIGVQGIVIKCHSYSTTQGVAKAVYGAIDLVKKKFMETVRSCSF